MWKFLLFVLLVAGSVVWFGNYVKTGKFEQFLDTHTRKPQINAGIEYYWAILDDLANKVDNAEYRYRRVFEKYPDTKYAPLAWVGLIEMQHRLMQYDQVIDQCHAFLDKYPDHSKAPIIRKKIAVIRSGI